MDFLVSGRPGRDILRIQGNHWVAGWEGWFVVVLKLCKLSQTVPFGFILKKCWSPEEIWSRSTLASSECWRAGGGSSGSWLCKPRCSPPLKGIIDVSTFQKNGMEARNHKHRSSRSLLCKPHCSPPVLRREVYTRSDALHLEVQGNLPWSLCKRSRCRSEAFHCLGAAYRSPGRVLLGLRLL